MKVLVIYESMYGNTAAVASAIADGIARSGVEAHARPVTEVRPTQAAEADLLILGGPTHAHGMSRPSTRNTAAADNENAIAQPTVTPGLRDWIAGLPRGNGRPAAAFDTRIDKPVLLTGSAAKGIRRRLEHRGYHLVFDPESFFVSTDNSLLDGEIEHAMRWGIAAAAATAAAARAG
jgi:hypothetical protein